MVTTWLVLLAATLAGADRTPAPPFERFPAALSDPARPARLRLTDPLSRSFRSALREARRGRSNFAGHYILTQIGCGAACIQVAAIDRKTGSIGWFPATISNWPLAETEPLAFRRDSRLLVVQGILDERGPAKRRLYLFEHNRFRPLGDVSR